MIKQLNKGLALLLATVLALSLSGALLTAFATDDVVEGYEYNEVYELDNVYLPDMEDQYELFNPFTEPPWVFPGQGGQNPGYDELYIYCSHRDCPFDCCFNVFWVHFNDVGSHAYITLYLVYRDGRDNPIPGAPYPYPVPIRILSFTSDDIDDTLVDDYTFRVHDPGQGTATISFVAPNGKSYNIFLYWQGNTLMLYSHLIQPPPCTCDLKDIEVLKVWLDDDNELGFRPNTIDVQLTKDEIPRPDRVAELTEAGEWTYRFTNVNRLRTVVDGEAILYDITAIEPIVPEHYEVYDIVHEECEEYGVYRIRIYNILTYEPIPPVERGVGDILVIKVWEDDDDAAGLRPDSIQVQVLRGFDRYGEDAEPLDSPPWVVSAEEDWERLIPDLYEYCDVTGAYFYYGVTEVNVPDGYTYEVAPGVVIEGVLTFIITNTLEDDNGQPPNGQAPVTGDVATAVPFVATILLSMSAVLGGTSLKNRFRR